MTNAMTNHSDMESLAAFVDGRLEREEREAVTKHLETCEECQSMIREAAAFEQEEDEAAAVAAAQKQRRTWRAVAAGVAIVVLTSAPFVPEYRHGRALKNDTQKYFLAIGDAPLRKIEARFGGQMAHSEYRVNRGAPATDDSSLYEDQVKSAAATLAEAAEGDQSPAGRRAAALGETATDPAGALAILNSIPVQARDAVIWNDIAALRYHLQDNQGALTAVKEALSRNPEMPEALYNRALILQREGDLKTAREAWSQYVEVDKFSTWANEAPRHLSRLRESQ